MNTPKQAARWRDDSDLTTTAVEELLRFTTPVPCGTARTLLDEVSIDGTVMPKGSKVMGMIISANRDEAVFDEPDALDLGRDPNRHLTFAFGKHFCLGNQLARLEGQISIGALVRRSPRCGWPCPVAGSSTSPCRRFAGFRTLPVTLR